MGTSASSLKSIKMKSMRKATIIEETVKEMNKNISNFELSRKFQTAGRDAGLTREDVSLSQDCCIPSSLWGQKHSIGWDGVFGHAALVHEGRVLG